MEVGRPIAVLRAQQADQLPTSWGVSGGIPAPVGTAIVFVNVKKETR